jgi:hypothetical protein
MILPDACSHLRARVARIISGSFPYGGSSIRLHSPTMFTISLFCVALGLGATLVVSQVPGYGPICDHMSRRVGLV